MITIKTDMESYVSIYGHAGYAPRGEDIVCAAVSVLYETLKRVLQDVGGDVSEDDGRTLIKVCASNAGKETDDYLKFFFTGIQALEQAYPKHVHLIRE